jgi:hypothetical protein
MITKGDLVLSAFEEARISGLTVSPSPGEVTSAVKRLDNMVLAWQNKGLCLSYIKSEGFSNVDPNQNSGLDDTSAQAVILNLTKMICPMYGKPIHPQTSGEARIAYLGLFSVELTMREADTYQPIGSGSRRYGYYCAPKFQGEDKNAPSDCSTEQLKVGETKLFSFDFNRYLDVIEFETIVSYVIDSGESITISDDSELEGVISYYATGGKTGANSIIITVTTETRVNPETIAFNVTSK